MINPATVNLIEKKAGSYEATKERILTRIRDNINVAIEKLRLAEQELLSKAEDTFAVNPFKELLDKINAGVNCASDEIENVMKTEIPEEFGPSEKSFCSLCEAIDSFKSWKRERKEKMVCLDLIPKNVRTIDVTHDRIVVTWDKIDEDCFYEIELKSPTAQNMYHSLKQEYSLCDLEPNTKYRIRVRTISQSSNIHVWSNPITVQTRREVFGCVWKECPEYVNPRRKYSVNGENPRIATKVGHDNWCSSTIIGCSTIPPNRISSWNIKIRKSMNNNGSGICIGVAPYDIDQNTENQKKCGWYYNCWNSTLFSGPPHNYNLIGKSYGPKKWFGKNIGTRDIIGVVMNTVKGTLTYIIDNMNYGVAYEGIPLDRPLVPCVLLYNNGDTIEISPRDAFKR